MSTASSVLRSADRARGAARTSRGRGGCRRAWRPLAALVLVAAALTATGTTHAAFTGSTANPGSAVAAHPDWTPPVVARATILKGEGGIPGYMRPTGQYRMIAHIVDDPSGNPEAGLGAITAFAAALPMTASAETVMGLPYTHTTALRASAPANTYTANINATDLANPANAMVHTATGLVSEADVPDAQSLAIANTTGTAGRADAGDTLTFRWNEVVDPDAVLNTWDGAAAQNVTVRIANNANNDTLTVWNDANAAQLPLGQVALGGNYVGAATTYGATGAAVRSTVAWAGDQLGFVVRLGTPSAAGGTVGTGTHSWTPGAGVYDRAGNPSTTAAIAEPAPVDVDF